MNYIYNGEIRCKKEDLERAIPLVKKIFLHPDVEELDGVTYIVISDETGGNITEEIDIFCQTLKEMGLSVAGNISFTGDYDGKYILSGSEYTELSAEECVIRNASDQDLLKEVKRRGYLVCFPDGSGVIFK